MKRLAIALLLGTTLSACTPTQITQSVPIVGNVCSAAEGTLVDEKVVYAAQVIYNIPAQAYVSADKNKKLTPAMKATLKPLLIKLDDLRNTVKAAKGTVNCDFEQMKALQVQIIQLLPR
jgi:hypothetical protein